MNRILDVVRMHTVVRMTFVIMPLIILVGAFALTLAVFAIIPGDSVKIAGSAQAPVWYFMSAGIMAQAKTFPFSQAMSITRREFFLGTMLIGLLSSAGFAAIAVVLGLIENATDGWGMNGRMYFLDDFGDGNVLVAFLAYLVITMFVFTSGLVFATIYKRFKTLGLWAAIGLVAVALVGSVFLITATDSWGPVGSFLTTAGPLVLSAIGIVVIAAIGSIDYLVLRRTQP